MGFCTTVGCSDSSELVKPVNEGIGSHNPVLKQVLGICSALAVTGLVSTTVVMCIALVFVCSMSTLIISLIRDLVPHRVRLIVQMLVVSTLVMLVHQYLRAYHFEMSRALGPYVGLIITNCIILGRCEGYAMRNGPVLSFLDGFGNAAGYGLVLLAIALIREPLGAGTLYGFRITPGSFDPALLAKAAPGAFLAMGVVVWVVRAIWPDAEPTSEHPEADV